MTASTIVPDHNEPAPTRLLDAEPAEGEVAAVDEDNTGLPLIGRRSVGYQQRFVFTLTALGIIGLLGGRRRRDQRGQRRTRSRWRPRVRR